MREPSVCIAAAGGKIYLDLCSEDWQTVEIDADGWRVVADPPVFFVRPAGMRPLLVPRSDESREGLAVLRKLVDFPRRRLHEGLPALCLLARRLLLSLGPPMRCWW